MPLQDILASITELTAGELSVVIATASQLKIEKSANGAPRSQVKPGKRGLPSLARKKGPAQLDSKFSDVHEYREFKSSEKELRSFLKSKNMSLKEANSSPAVQDDPVLTRFRTAQAVWFRFKAQLKGQAAESSSTPPKAAETLGGPGSSGPAQAKGNEAA